MNLEKSTRGSFNREVYDEKTGGLKNAVQEEYREVGHEGDARLDNAAADGKEAYSAAKEIASERHDAVDAAKQSYKGVMDAVNALYGQVMNMASKR
jgi:hypothetical protein